MSRPVLWENWSGSSPSLDPNAPTQNVMTTSRNHYKGQLSSVGASSRSSYLGKGKRKGEGASSRGFTKVRSTRNCNHQLGSSETHPKIWK